MEKDKDLIMFGSKTKGVATIAFVIVACIFVGVGTYLVTKKPDTPVEQFAEDVLKSQTGIDIDFSPEGD